VKPAHHALWIVPAADESSVLGPDSTNYGSWT
jgi:hypothetical protein